MLSGIHAETYRVLPTEEMVAPIGSAIAPLRDLAKAGLSGKRINVLSKLVGRNGIIAINHMIDAEVETRAQEALLKSQKVIEDLKFALKESAQEIKEMERQLQKVTEENEKLKEDTEGVQLPLLPPEFQKIVDEKKFQKRQAARAEAIRAAEEASSKALQQARLDGKKKDFIETVTKDLNKKIVNLFYQCQNRDERIREIRKYMSDRNIHVTNPDNKKHKIAIKSLAEAIKGFETEIYFIQDTIKMLSNLTDDTFEGVELEENLKKCGLNDTEIAAFCKKRK